MTPFLRSGAALLLAHVISSIALAALLCPWLYQAGKALSLHSASRDLIAPLEWFAAACGRAPFDRFFNRCLILSALLLTPLLVRALRRPDDPSLAHLNLQPLLPRPRRALHFTVGLLAAAGFLAVLGAYAVHSHEFHPRVHAPSLSRWFSKALAPALFAGILEEWLFRGIILGLWLRALRPSPALFASSALFAALHFLKPDARWQPADPDSAAAGFELLAAIGRHWIEPQFFVGEWLTLFLIGLTLAYTRLRTRSLWLACGLHVGWILAYKSFNLWFQRPAAETTFLLGTNLRSGVLPLLTVAVTAATVAAFLHFESRRRASQSG